MPNSTSQSDKRIIDRRHPEWAANVIPWQKLLDSYDGGSAYRWAQYGSDAWGLPDRMLIRHPRECPFTTTNGETVGSFRNPEGDDYISRLVRTPVPDFVHEAVEIHLATIYESEVTRDGPAALKAFWEDVDGKGTAIGDWLCDDAAPLLLTLGQLDFCVDHPAIPKGDSIVSMADEKRLKVNEARLSYILPMNLLWWSLDEMGRYTECLVREPQETEEPLYRHWFADGWTLYANPGNSNGMTGIGPMDIEDFGTHKYGRPPIVRVFDRKSPRFRNVGKSRYETIAELMRAYYNKDSELTLSDTLQAFPLLQGPEDFCIGNNVVPVGPNGVIPKKRHTSGDGYEPWETVDFPKGGADSIRANLAIIRDAADRSACLTKPAGGEGTDGKTVAQSGISKRLDAANGSKLLGKIAGVLANAERQIAQLALLVLGKVKPADIDAIKIAYSGSFDLFSADELAVLTEQIQDILADAGQAPDTELMLVMALIKQGMPGLEPDKYKSTEAEIKSFIDAKAKILATQHAAGIDPKSGQPIIPPPPPPPLPNPAATVQAVTASQG